MQFGPERIVERMFPVAQANNGEGREIAKGKALLYIYRIHVSSNDP